MLLIFHNYQISNNFLSTWASSLHLKASFNLMTLLTRPVFSSVKKQLWAKSSRTLRHERIVVCWQKSEAGRHTFSGLHELQPTALCMDWTVVASNFTGLVTRLVIHDWWEKSQLSSAVSLQLHIGMVCLWLSAHRKHSTHITRHHMRLCHDNQVMWPHGTCYIKVWLSHDRISHHLHIPLCSGPVFGLELISDSTGWNFFSNI